ncbi:MAG: hypothetical protein QM767_18295 [Anaeromyxobacter sp.]
MRPRLAIAVVLILAACGSDSNSSNPPANPTLTATGSIALSATNFTGIGKAVTCSVEGIDFGVAFAAVGASDEAGLCSYLQNAQDKQDAKTITLAIFKVNPTGTTAAITTGTYPVTTNPGLSTEYAFVFVSQNDAQCVATDVEGASGNIVVTSVTADRIIGTADVTLDGGGKVTGSFDAPYCDVSLPGDVCAGDIGPGETTCVP